MKDNCQNKFSGPNNIIVFYFFKKYFFILIALVLHNHKPCFAQQKPYYTQFRNNIYLINPAVTGTKRELDARINYRMQWVGYDNAPRTYSVSAHSRFLKGKMGAGVYMMQDNVGPFKQMNLGVSYAYHLKFPDCELSFGAAGNFTRHSLLGELITIHHTLDPAIDQNVTSSNWVGDANAGMYLYNDRFHLGVSGLHLTQVQAEFYKNDTTKKGLVPYAPNINFTLGYNYSQNPDYIWESTIFATYTRGTPFVLDYTMRMHYKEQFFTGLSVRLKDAIAIHLGVTLFEYVQVSYSYDLLIGKLRNYSSGSHEIMLVYSHNPFNKNKRRRGDNRFLHQRYGYLF